MKLDAFATDDPARTITLIVVLILTLALVVT
jgi:hypothetical protein